MDIILGRGQNTSVMYATWQRFTLIKLLLKFNTGVFFRQVNEETIEAREQATLLKQRRQMQAQKSREKIKQAFLKKKLEKLKAAEKKQKDAEAEQHIQEGSQ